MTMPDDAGFPDDSDTPELRLLRETGNALEAVAPVPDTGAEAVRLRAEAVQRGLVPEPLEMVIARVGDELENFSAANFDADAHSARLRETAEAQGLLRARASVSEPALAGTASDQSPFFFLSYAHSPRDDRGDPEPDLWIHELYRDLCEHVSQLADLPKSTPAGFMDRELQQGYEWPDRLANALATCRVFVPLYSRRYFKSEHCGKEWFAFNMRRLNHKAKRTQPVETIIPALWTPLPERMLPQAAISVQSSSVGFNEPYAEHGFYGIMKLRRFADAYEEAVYHLARRIVSAAEASPPVPTNPIPYDSLLSAFDGNSETGPGDKPLRITVVAPGRDELPAGRDQDYYGNDFRAWNPYRGESVRPLASHAAELARSLSYTPEVGDLFEREAGLAAREVPSKPEVLLIDPCAALLPDCSEVLRELDAMDTPWVQMVVVWSQGDYQMRTERDRLRAALEETLPRKLREGRATHGLAVHGIPSLEEFSLVFPKVVADAGRHYLRLASARPPQQPLPHREPDKGWP
jgi:FxsC-like protein